MTTARKKYFRASFDFNPDTVSKTAGVSAIHATETLVEKPSRPVELT